MANESGGTKPPVKNLPSKVPGKKSGGNRGNYPAAPKPTPPKK